MSDDPCTCNVPCPHGVLCSGGHANYPDSHWWPCCEQGCAGEVHTIHMLKLGGYIAVMAGCGHALVGEELGPLTRQGAAHLRDCAGRDERMRAEGRRQAAADALRDMADRIDRGPAIPLPPSVYSALIRERADDIAEAAPAEPLEEMDGPWRDRTCDGCGRSVAARTSRGRVLCTRCHPGDLPFDTKEDTRG